jgi:preprotein translocase subunit SecY
MATALPDLGKMTELRQRLLFLLGALVVFRIGTHIPVPGIDPHAMAQLFEPAARHHPRHVQHVFRRRTWAG